MYLPVLKNIIKEEMEEKKNSNEIIVVGCGSGVCAV